MATLESLRQSYFTDQELKEALNNGGGYVIIYQYLKGVTPNPNINPLDQPLANEKEVLTKLRRFLSQLMYTSYLITTDDTMIILDSDYNMYISTDVNTPVVREKYSTLDQAIIAIAKLSNYAEIDIDDVEDRMDYFHLDIEHQEAFDFGIQALGKEEERDKLLSLLEDGNIMSQPLQLTIDGFTEQHISFIARNMLVCRSVKEGYFDLANRFYYISPNGRKILSSYFFNPIYLWVYRPYT